MSNFFTGSTDFLYLIIREITDSKTWCRVSRTCKRANKLCNELLIEKTRPNNWRALEKYTTMPNGKKHGKAQKIPNWEIVNWTKHSNVYYYKDDERLILPVDWWEK